jgi:hypothetical protein
VWSNRPVAVIGAFRSLDLGVSGKPSEAAMRGNRCIPWRSVAIKKPPGSGYHCLLVRAPEETDPAKPLVVSLQNALIWYFGRRFEHFLDEGSNVLVKVRNVAKINEQNPIVMP